MYAYAPTLDDAAQRSKRIARTGDTKASSMSSQFDTNMFGNEGAHSSRDTVAAAWNQLVATHGELDEKDTRLVFEKLGGSELRSKANSGDVLAAVTLLRFARYCLAFPDSPTLPARDKSASRTMVAGLDDCLAFFGPEVRTRRDLQLLRVDWYRTVAASGFDAAAPAFWRALSGIRTSGALRGDSQADAQARADQVSLALSLLTTAAERGNVDAIFLLVEAFADGVLVRADEAKARIYARRLVALPEYANIPWLRKLAEGSS